ncbi:DUF1905 domain-containing protein [Cellulomonas soli]|uniref:DUF1905 domain-containing protein n=1 Tax=Cellulomonas soli TaxID=931535 RepID=A0A512PEA9_9CELL|nr:DUF1905 domain-containing protein [Cellulomonas soli]NYI59035.1 hypothetical protein [Cellulomonas soli]GEP69472.1 hypothetical protein CSO01_21870 [Cellulomonas soli]
MDLRFSGELWYWRGPSPYHFVTVPEEESAAVRSAASQVSYGWGVIPVTAQVEGTRWTTSLFPKDGHYLVPVKDAVRRAEDLQLGDEITVVLTVDVPEPFGRSRPRR